MSGKNSPAKRQIPYRTLRATLRRHRGTIAALARSLDPPVTPAAIHGWLAGRMVCTRIREAARWWVAVINTFEAKPGARSWSKAEWRVAVAQIEQRYKAEWAAKETE